MIVVDTSVWVDALRGRRQDNGVANILTSLLDADEVALPLPVRVELLSGAARRDRSKLTHALAGLPVLSPGDDTWQLLTSWIEPAANAGQRFAVTDLLVAALATEIGALVWSLDGDFERMAALRMVQLYG